MKVKLLKKSLKDFFQENNCSEEEKLLLYNYSRAIKIIPYLEDLENLYVTLKLALERK